MCEGLALLAMICGAIDQSTRCSGFPPFCRWVMDGGAFPVLPVAGQHSTFFLQVLSWKGMNQALAAGEEELPSIKFHGSSWRKPYLDKAKSVGIKTEEGLRHIFFYLKTIPLHSYNTGPQVSSCASRAISTAFTCRRWNNWGTGRSFHCRARKNACLLWVAIQHFIYYSRPVNLLK